jgi:hypothetical protein
MLHIVLYEALAFVVYFVCLSFFEWWFHRFMFHSPKINKRTFRAHTLIHHQDFKYEPESYEWRAPREKKHIAMDWWSLPLFIVTLSPAFILMQFLTKLPTFWGGLAAVVVYYTVYESLHYLMHVPGKYAIERTSFFQFVKEHHRVHHKYMLRNLNVFFPFADIVMGTYRTATIPARMDRVADRKRERAQAAAAVLAQAAAEHQQDGNEAQTTSTKAPQGVNAG